MKRKISLGLVALAVAVGMTACGGGDSDGASADTGDFCAEAKSFTDISSTTGSLFEDGATDPEDFEKSWTKITDSLEKFEKAAPDEVQGDIATVTGVFDGFNDLLEESDYDLQAIIAKAASDPSVFEQFENLEDNAEVEAAAERVEEYVKAECGIDLDSES